MSLKKFYNINEFKLLIYTKSKANIYKLENKIL